jgi:hypothetical protein
MSPNDGSFWTSLPGILTALAGLIAAVGSLVGVLYSSGLIGKGRGKSPGPPGDAGAAVRPPPPPPSPPLELRGAPTVLTSGALQGVLVRHGFFEADRHPSGRGPAHRYEVRMAGAMAVVSDGATGLMWQQGGSERPMPFEDARAHVDRLNAERAGGFDDWRLPTADEVLSLLEPEPAAGLHIGSVFQPRVGVVWTADHTPRPGRGWVVYFGDGIIAPEPHGFNALVRAVRSEPS